MTTRQLSLDLSTERRRRDEGIDLALGSSPALWPAYAYRKLREVAEANEYVHVDDLYAVLEWRPKPNAMGAIWLRARREGWLVRTGELRPTRLERKHAHPYPVYRSLIWKGQNA